MLLEKERKKIEDIVLLVLESLINREYHVGVAWLDSFPVTSHA